MAKIGYSPVSIISAICGALATAAASSDPSLLPLAAGLGTAVSAAIGGVELGEDQKLIKDKISEEMDIVWEKIRVDYRLPEVCFNELKQEIMGEGTSVEEFVRNTQRKYIKQSLGFVILNILNKHRDLLKGDSEYSWDDSFSNAAADQISGMIISTITAVLSKDDIIIILLKLEKNREAEQNEHKDLKDTVIETGERVIERVLSESNLFHNKHETASTNQAPFFNLPSIKARVMPPCEPYIETGQRRKDLDDLKTLFFSSRCPLFVYGEGGIGKTELVLHFAEENSENEYLYVKYKGSINQTLSRSFFYTSGNQKVPQNDIERYYFNMDTIARYQRMLHSQNKSLILIIDNYTPDNYEKTFQEMTELPIENGYSGKENDIKEIDNLIAMGIRLIITTRIAPEYSDAYNTFEVKPMGKDALYELMIHHFNRITPFREYEAVKGGIKEKLYKLITISGLNTAFITIMALAMQNSTMEPVEALNKMISALNSDNTYLTKYSGKFDSMQGHLEKMLGFIGLSYQDKQVLGTLAMIPEEGIDYDLYQELTLSGAVQLDSKRKQTVDRFIKYHIAVSEYGDGGEAQHEKDDFPGLLREQETLPPSQSAITNQPSNRVRRIRVHPIVAEHARRILSNKNKAEFFNSIYQNWVIKLLYYYNDEELERLKITDQKYKYLSQVADACSFTANLLQSFGDNDHVNTARRSLILKASDLCSKRGNIKDAVEYIERVINVEGAYHEDFDILLYRLNEVGKLFLQGGRYQRAKHSFDTMLAVLNDRNMLFVENIEEYPNSTVDLISELDDASTYGVVFGNIAQVYHEQGDYAKTLEYGQKALAICERVLGKDHPNTALIYNIIGAVYLDQGDYGKATEFYHKALSTRDCLLGEDNLDTAMINNNIGRLYSNQGDYAKALEYGQKTLTICERVLGKDHPDTATSYNNIGAVYLDQGDCGKTLEYYQKALAIRERVLGKDHPDTAMSYNNIGTLYSNQGDYGKALDYYQKALATRKCMLGEDHPDTVSTYSNIGTVYFKQGDFGKALEYLQKALAFRERVLGEDHPDIAMTYGNIGIVYGALGDYVKALKYYLKDLTISKRVLGEDHPNTATTYSNIGTIVYRALGDYVKAMEYYQKALAIREKVLGKEHPDTVTTRNIIANLNQAHGG